MFQSSRQLHEKFTVNEIYQLSQTDANWGIYGYKIPKTYDYNYNSTEYSVPKDQNRDLYHDINKRAKDPDPTTYAEDPKLNLKKSLSHINGKFSKAKKDTVIDEVMKQSARVPGPGKYEEKKNSTLPKTTSLGKFDKCEKIGFLSTVEALAEEIPSTWKYNPQSQPDRKKSNWCKTAKTGKKIKGFVGPGHYQHAEEGLDKYTVEAKPKYSIPRAKSARTISTASTTLRTPGVGTYENSDQLTSIGYLIKKSSRRVIHPYKAKRYMDEVERLAAGVPGPGAYEIGLKLKKNKKFR